MRTQSFVTRAITGLMTLSAITAATAIAWLANEWIVGTRMDNTAYDLWRDFSRSIDGLYAADPILAAFILPIVLFLTMALIVFMYVRRCNG